MPMSRLSFAHVAAVAVFCPAAGYAHHSFSAEYDRDKPIELTGTVTKVEWTNPHARIYIDVEDADGNVVNWDFELGPPNGLMRQGWTRNSLKAGDVITVLGSRARDGSTNSNARSVQTADGTRLFAGSSQDTTP
jgi:hypothetical protein